MTEPPEPLAPPAVVPAAVAAPTAPPPPMRGATPYVLALLVAFAAQAAVGVVVDLLRVGAAGSMMEEGGRLAYARLSLIDTGVIVAARILVLVGAIELLRRTTGRAQLGARLVVFGASILVGLMLVRQVLSFTPSFGGRSLGEWLRYVYLAGEYAIAAGLLVASWPAPRARPLGIALVLVTLVAVPIDPLRELIYEPLQDAGYKYVMTAWAVAAALASSLAALVVWKTPTRPATPSFDAAARGFDRAAGAMYARLIIAIAGALLFISLAGSRGEGAASLAKVWLIGVPGATALAGVVLGVSLYQAAGIPVPRADRICILLGGGLLLWTVGVQATQTAAAYRALDGGSGGFDADSAEPTLRALSIGLPLVNAAGLALVAWATRGVGRAAGNGELERSGASALTVTLLCNLGALAVTFLAQEQRSVGTVLLFMLVALVLSVIALVAVARVCRQAASVCRARGLIDVFSDGAPRP